MFQHHLLKYVQINLFCEIATYFWWTILNKKLSPEVWQFFLPVTSIVKWHAFETYVWMTGIHPLFNDLNILFCICKKCKSFLFLNLNKHCSHESLETWTVPGINPKQNIKTRKTQITWVNENKNLVSTDDTDMSSWESVFLCGDMSCVNWQW